MTARKEGWTRASTKPANIGWYERKYPLIAGQHQHPCPFDFWNGIAWLGGFPDKQGDVLPTGHKVQAATIANDQHPCSVTSSAKGNK